MGKYKVHAKITGPIPNTVARLATRQLDRRANPEPPRKRQCLQNGNICAQQGDTIDSVVTLVEVDIDLEFERDYSTLPSRENWGYHNRLSVILDSIEIIENDKYRLRISGTEGECLFDAVLLSNTLRPALEELQLSIESRRDNRKSLKHIREPNGANSAISQWFLILPHDSKLSTIQLQTRIKWRTRVTPSTSPMNLSPILSKLLSIAFPKGKPDTADSWSPQDFYRSVHVPNKDLVVPAQIQSDQVHCQLYPFQKRAVRWMLYREGVDIGSGGQTPNYQCERDADAPPLFYPGVDANGHRCLVSHILGVISTQTVMKSSAASISGGILAEEMGLGKTVELISLICLHKRQLFSHGAIHDLYSQSLVSPSPATLIITPPSILQQWQNELATHAPALKVLRYEGLKRNKLSNDTLIRVLLQQDVVLTTYNVLSSEIHYAGSISDRQLRRQKRYVPRRSPLIQISWWRVCLDEAQMVESGVSNAATVARLIPRCNAWAVSGTPVRKDVKDLLGLLVFLRYEPFCDHPQLWSRLVTSFKDSFHNVFSQIAIRHTKEGVRDEIRLPPQKRVVVTVPFTQIEEQHYNHLFQQMCDDCGLDIRGEKMRSWLARLRQTCLHPEVGIGNRRALGHGDGPLRTVGEVLEVMIDQNQLAIRTEQRSLLISKIRRGQILENYKLCSEALDIWLQSLQESDAIVEEILSNSDRLGGSNEGDKGNGGDTLGNEDESDGASEAARPDEPGNRSNTDRLRLRSALEVQHMCAFFSANAYFQIKMNEDTTIPNSKEFKLLAERETALYEKAKEIRKQMLSDVLRKVGRLMKVVGRKANSQAFIDIPEGIPSVQSGGIESRKLLESFEALVGALNVQANQLDEWRESVVQLLLRPLVDEDDGIEVQGDEYETSTKEQDSLYVYMEALRAAVADRHDALTGQTNFLVQEGVKFIVDNAKNGKGPLPRLLLDLLAVRLRLKPGNDNPSMRSMVTDMRALSATLRWQGEGGSTRARAELAIVEKKLANFQTFMRNQTKAIAGLEQELELFRSTMNARLEYYRQLQQISDTVAPLENKKQRPDATERMLGSEEKSGSKIASLKAKHKYLINLRHESSNQEAQRTCVICQQMFEIGALTVCGHQYCKECIRLWWSEHRSCPICKKHLSSNDFHHITYKPREPVLEEERHEIRQCEIANSPTTSIYSNISNSTLGQIKNIDLDGSFGTKIDTIARHLLWIRENDPGAKAILFSQYREFLAILERALDQFRISFTSMGCKGGVDKFKNDPGIECFLLDAKANSSGLNFVNATHVFLCEPLINTALELQAIARVHRIGQHQPTTIWMYLVDGTVEKSIYEISVSRRISHIGSNSTQVSTHAIDTLEKNIEAANSLEMEKTPLAKLLVKEPSGGEMVQNEDLWSCLFHHTRKGPVGETNGTPRLT
ncbi:MAG: hypothetical protein M1840_000994 [Geoglossum simile]|nr:MAG: hypothetical protein M1840_000994 [Geoglossum simile]